MSSTIRWDPQDAPQRYGDLRVAAVCVIARNPVMAASSDLFAPPSKAQTNHWILLLKVNENVAIGVDPSLGNSYRLLLNLEVKPEEDILKVGTAWNLQLQAKGLTARTFLECIIEARYDRYKFAPSGQGCRYWIAHVLTLLSAKGYLGDVKAAIDATNVVWDGGNPALDAAQSTPEKGAFF